MASFWPPKAGRETSVEISCCIHGYKEKSATRRPVPLLWGAIPSDPGEGPLLGEETGGLTPLAPLLLVCSAPALPPVGQPESSAPRFPSSGWRAGLPHPL